MVGEVEAVLRNGDTQHVSGTPVTHGALCHASLVVCHCGVPVCAVCSCTSSVLTCDAHHTYF